MATFFERPPQISTIGGAKLRNAAMTASGCVPCESLTKRTPSTFATGSRRCSTPMKSRDGATDRVRRNAEQQTDGDRRQDVADVVLAGQRDLVDRHDPAARAGHRDGVGAQLAHVVRDDPAIAQADAAGQRNAASVERDRRVSGLLELGRNRVLGVEHQPSVRAAAAPPGGA